MGSRSFRYAGRLLILAAVFILSICSISACSGMFGKSSVNSSAYLGEYSYNSPISAMVYEDMGTEGLGIQYRMVTDYDKLIAYSPIPVCLYFYGGLDTDDSGITAEVEQLAENYHGKILFVSVDAEQNNELASHFELEALPDFVLLENGSLKASFSSFDGKTWTGRDLEEWILANIDIS